MQKALDNSNNTLEMHEMIEVLLFHVIPRGNTNEIAHRLLNEFGNLYSICHAETNELTAIEGVGIKTAEYLKMLPTYVKIYELGIYGKKPCLDTTENLGRYCQILLRGSRDEELHILFLNARKQLIARELLGIGDATTVQVGYKKIMRAALNCKPMYAVLTHNHPSGSIKASNNDINFTRNLKDYLRTIDIILEDHIIVTDEEYMSFVKTKVSF